MVQATTPRKTAPVFTLEELAPSDYVELFGKRYMIANLEARGLRARAALQAAMDRITELERRALAGNASDVDEVEYDQRLREFVPMYVDGIPADVLSKMGTGQLADMTSSFFVWRATKGGRLIDSLMNLVTSVSSSPGSPASTAAGNGSSKRRSRSSRHSAG